MNEEAPLNWDKFLIEGDKLFNYMIYNYNIMLSDNRIKHFYIIDNIWGFDIIVETITHKYNDDIHNIAKKWIMKEFLNNELFEKKYWKPFRDKYTLLDMYLGYKKLFVYKNYYFQLIIESTCELYECVDCTSKNNKIHFALALYGQQEENKNIQQCTNDIIPEYAIMPEYDWVKK